MQQIEGIHPLPPDVVTASIGGRTIIRNGEYDVEFIAGLAGFCRLIANDERSAILVFGAGDHLPAGIQEPGDALSSNPDILDKIGIAATQRNAEHVHALLIEHGVPAELGPEGKKPGKGIIYTRGGDTPGHTTDLVTVRTAIGIGEQLVFNISSRPGLHPVWRGKLLEDRIIQNLSWPDYLRLFPHIQHSPGIRIPFDTLAAREAQSHGITVVLLGTDLNNVEDCMRGRSFKGTILHP